MIDDGLEQRPQILAGDVGRERGRARFGAGVEHRKIQLVLDRVEVDEEVVDLVQDFLDPRVGPIDLVDDNDRRQAPLERLPQNEACLRQRPLRRVDQQQHAVNHRERPLDFAAEVRVAGVSTMLISVSR